MCNSSSGWLDSEALGFLLLEPGMVILCAWGLLRITVLSYGAPLSCVSGAEICPVFMGLFFRRFPHLEASSLLK